MCKIVPTLLYYSCLRAYIHITLPVFIRSTGILISIPRWCGIVLYVPAPQPPHISYLDPISTRPPAPGAFYTYLYSYNHAHRLRLEKLLYYIELSRSPSEYFNFKPIPDPGGRCSYKFITARCNGHFPMDAIARSGVTVM